MDISSFAVKGPLVLMCACVHDEILEAQSQGHTNLYLNYRMLSELPEKVLTLSKIKKLYLKRNVLKKLVIGFILAQTRFRFCSTLLISYTFVF